MSATTAVERSAHRDKAVLAIAPLVLGLTPKGEAELIAQGSMYLSDDELQKLHAIVMRVERALR